MRSYPVNSPEAAARIVAVALLADAHLCGHELDTLQRHGAYELLQIDRDAMRKVIQGVTEDLMTGGGIAWTGSAALDPATMRSLLEEVQAPQLRKAVHDLCRKVAYSEQITSDAEHELLSLMEKQWQIPKVADKDGGE